MTSMAPRRLTGRHLDWLLKNLTTREREVLEVLATAQVATTAQLARVLFAREDESTATRLARRHLQRLRAFGLVRRFDDRSRDRRGGASGHVHALTAEGLRLSSGIYAIGARQRPSWRPSYPFLAHRLAITELYVQLTEQEYRGGARVREFAAEPYCWRRYTGPVGQRLVVRPDCLVRLVVDGDEVSTFCEIDLGTEAPAVLTDKMQTYRQYSLSGEEIRRHGVNPGVLFVVSGPERARLIVRLIARQGAEAQKLFAATTLDEAVVVLSSPDADGPPPSGRPPP